MPELLDTSYTLGVTFLLISMIIKKIQKLEGVETEEITIEIINKYLPEIEKHFPEIRKQLPQLEKYCRKQKLNKHKKQEHHKKCDTSDSEDYKKIIRHFKPLKEESEPHNYHEFSTSHCEPIKHLPKNKYHCDCYVKSESSESSESLECKPCSKHHKHYDTDTSDEKSSEYSASSEKDSVCSEHIDKKKKHCKKICEPNEIDDRIKKIKVQLEKLSDTDEEFDYDDKEHIKHINDFKCKEVSDEEEKSASHWDLCELKKSCKPCKHECGKFAIDEDLHVFKNKVIKKAEIIISCYKKKLLECEENRHHLEKCLEKCRKNNCILEEKLDKCHCFLKECEEDKNKIMHKAKKCEKELAFLLKKYHELEREYKKKKEELEKCRCNNAHLIKELHNIKCELKKCLHEKDKLRKEVEKLHCALEACKRDKKHLLEIIHNLKEKIKKCECENSKLECIIRELKEEIHRLKRKVDLLICQNKELQEENDDLKKQLGKTLTTLKCLCEKYNALKEKCKRKKYHC